MSVLPIYTYGMPVLRKKAKRITAVDDRVRIFVEDMFETMHNAGGIGLAANQVGSLERVIVIDISEMEELQNLPPETPGKKPLVLINPEVVHNEGKWIMEEGCLSIPEIRDDVERAEHITVNFKDIEWNDCQLTSSNLLGRVILHEIDHLDGILFTDHISKIKQKLLRGRLNNIRKGECDVPYPIVTPLVEEKKI